MNLTEYSVTGHAGGVHVRRWEPSESPPVVLDMPSLDKRIKIYPGAKHEPVNEINREEVIADLSHWVAGVLH